MARRTDGSDAAPGGRAGGAGAGSDAATLADRLHSLAIHLLRQLRREDEASGLSAPRLSALSVVVFAGPLSMSRLAELEQVRLPTMSRLVRALEAEGLVRRTADPGDARSVRLHATARGTRLLHAGRARRVASLAGALSVLPVEDRRRLASALSLLDEVVHSLRGRE